MGSSRRIEKCPQSGWGCMGGGATDQCLEDHLHPVQLYGTVYSVPGTAQRRQHTVHSAQCSEHAVPRTVRTTHYDITVSYIDTLMILLKKLRLKVHNRPLNLRPSPRCDR
jgi:hypothetical protein